MIQEDTGNTLYSWAKDLFPICRSITGEGVRETLRYIQGIIPDMTLHEVPTGTAAFDWEVPKEWNIRDAYIADMDGKRVVDFKAHNLHVVGYSTPIDVLMPFHELDAHLYSLPDQPEAIPYITSYYHERWGFCLSEVQRNQLRTEPDAMYHVVIDSTLAPGVLNYGEYVLPGETKEEILLSTYVCHPSMANNELSGPVVATGLARWLSQQPKQRYTYRILFLVETIGSIVYLSKHLDHLISHVKAGFVLSCMGDDRDYSFLPSRNGNTLADKAAQHGLRHGVEAYTPYSFLDRGSDERQYCSPLIDLPVCSVMRSKYGTYPEYHTSLDNLDLISPKGLQGGFDIMQRVIMLLEINHIYRATTPCEPQLGKRGLYPTLSTKETKSQVAHMMHLLAYADGQHDLIDIADMLDIGALALFEIAEQLTRAGLLEIHSSS